MGQAEENFHSYLQIYEVTRSVELFKKFLFFLKYKFKKT